MYITCSQDPPLEANEKQERKSSRRLLVLAPLASTIQLPSTTLAAWIFTRIFIRRTSRTGYPIAPSKLNLSSLPPIGMTQFFRKYRVLMPSVRGVHQRANRAKPTQKVKAPTARTAPLVAKGMTRAQLNFFEMTKSHKPSIESSTRPRDRMDGGWSAAPSPVLCQGWASVSS